MILSPPENETLKYSPKLDKVFVDVDENPLPKNFQISPLQRTSVMKKNSLFGTFYFQSQVIWARQ